MNKMYVEYSMGRGGTSFSLRVISHHYQVGETYVPSNIYILLITEMDDLHFWSVF